MGLDGVSLWVLGCPYGSLGVPMGLGVSLWGCGEPTEGFYGAQTHRVLVASVGF